MGTLRQHTEFSGSLYNVANNAGKLIVIKNCKDLNHFFFLCPATRKWRGIMLYPPKF